MSHPITATPAPFDPVLRDLASYAVGPGQFGQEALTTATYCLMDSIGCGFLALDYPACVKLLGPVVPGAYLTRGSRVFGMPWFLDPVQAAFNLGCLIRWLDYNDTWLAAEWGHPSDNFGAILALADYLDRNPENPWTPGRIWTIGDALRMAIKAYEIQGVLALENSFNRVGLDHVLLVRVASTAVSCAMLGGTVDQVANALSQAFLDGGALRTYRHAPNTGSRKSWAAGDATRRAVQLALWTMTGEMGYPGALSAPKWGFQDVLFRGNPVRLGRSLGSYVMENILFKVAFPAEFHAQTAAEAAISLSPRVRPRLEKIKEIKIHTQESACRIIDKTGPLHNPADRDHCLQYIVAVALIHGELTAEHYEDTAAADPRIDALRKKMVVIEDPRYTRDYLDPDLRSIGNRLEIHFDDGVSPEIAELEFPIGHRRRRAEAFPLLGEKFRRNTANRLGSLGADALLGLFMGAGDITELRISALMNLLSRD